MSITHSSEDDLRNSEVRVNINGELFHREKASISVFDSGFLLGDGIWEGLRLHKGKWLFFDDHMERLYAALKAVEIEISLTKEDVHCQLEKTRLANNMETDAYARLMITRGKKSKAFQHPGFSIFGSTFVIIMEHSRPVLDSSKKGIKLVTVPQMRGQPMTQDPKLNSHSKLNCVIACLQSSKAGGDEALMLDPQGFVNTTNSCNFFIIRKGEVWTSTGDYCMNGITREKVIQICRNLGVPIYQRNFSLVDTYSAEGAFLTGTFGGLIQVFSIDGHQIGNGLEGAIAVKLRKFYEAMIEQN
ncbi:MAG: aminotransferase class IV [Rhodobacteraceae bacterium]|nr:MAG: aminotransferase class IV [Paracoccaceae bacterium]